jgi:hypothetical protein
VTRLEARWEDAKRFLVDVWGRGAFFCHPVGDLQLHYLRDGVSKAEKQADQAEIERLAPELRMLLHLLGDIPDETREWL